jgi:hypothetical protein
VNGFRSDISSDAVTFSVVEPLLPEAAGFAALLPELPEHAASDSPATSRAPVVHWSLRLDLITLLFTFYVAPSLATLSRFWRRRTELGARQPEVVRPIGPFSWRRSLLAQELTGLGACEGLCIRNTASVPRLCCVLVTLL